MMKAYQTLRALLKKLFSRDSDALFWRRYRRAAESRGLRRDYYRLFIRRAQRRGCSSLPISDKICEFTMPHGLRGIFISNGASIGPGCVIFHQVTIGSNTLPDSRRFGAPTIGAGVYIGAGAKIIGNVRVGDHARIGANCVVVDDVPANATVVLERPRVIPGPERDNTYYHWAQAEAMRPHSCV